MRSYEPPLSKKSTDQSRSSVPGRFRAIILAGDRTRRDSLRDHSGVTSKALIRIGGVPMIHRVILALQGATSVRSISLSGPDEESVSSDEGLRRWQAEGDLDWRPPEASPSTSAFGMLSAQPEQDPVLITTADHPLLTSEIVDHFCRDSAARDCDVVVGLAPHDIIKSAYPEIRKTVLRFSDGEYCGCNLFAFLTPEGRRIADFWRKIENERKKPLLLIGLLGWWSVLRYRLGLLSLESALAQLSRRLDLRLGAVVLPYANAAVDVDSAADYNLVQRYAAEPGPEQPIQAK
jgi:molybdopterin-guanine dinucleotide biosynthesis protein A